LIFRFNEHYLLSLNCEGVTLSLHASPHQSYPNASAPITKDPWLAVNLSMFYPGLGQIYAGYGVRGLGFFALQSLCLGIGFWSILSPEGDIISGLIYLLMSLGIYLGNMIDALLLVFNQNPQFYREKIPRQWKNPWFAVFASRILPGLGHFYNHQFIIGLIFFTLGIICLRLQAFYAPLLWLGPSLTAIAAYHVYRSFPATKSLQRTLISMLVGFIFVVGLALNILPQWLARSLDTFVIPSPSMVPTLQVGDRIFVQENPDYQPQRGDIVVFKPAEELQRLDPQPSEFYTKRVIGLPGETINISQGQVFINGQPLAEDYLAETPTYDLPSKAIPTEHYFLLGDNRNNSFDSHLWGVLPRKAIVGKAYKIYWPLDRVRSLLNVTR
jgi:signal peptidase I